MGKRWQAEHDIVKELARHGVSVDVDTRGNSKVELTDRQQWAFALSIVDMLEDAWDSGRSTGKYDALYQEPEAWEDSNPYRDREDEDDGE